MEIVPSLMVASVKGLLLIVDVPCRDEEEEEAEERGEMRG